MARHTYLCPLRWSDVDVLGHVNNVVFLRLVEEARVDLLYGQGVLERKPDEGFLVVRHEIDYKAQLRYRKEPLPIDVWVERAGNASFAITSELYDDRDQTRLLYARATTVLAPVNMTTGFPHRVSPELREQLARWTDA
ncbi:MAG: acyl-CoA thioesterase [Nocardioidaceae bacterium]|nr:MAG: acyl-CoA thioesterase [Nocardioidaceae bacterium]